MRVVLVAILVFFNVAFALWAYYGAPQRPPGSEIPATEPGVEPLVLWSQQDGAAGAAHRVPPVFAQDNGSAAAPSPSRHQADVAQPSVTTDAPGSVTRAGQEGDGAEPRGEAAGLEGLEPESTQQGGRTAAQAGPAHEPVCYLVGPYRTRAPAAELRDRLMARGTEARVLDRNQPEPRYWVYLPPYPNRAAAFAAEQALRAKGIEDIQVLAGNGAENGISLGLYREQGAAERRLEQLRGLGYQPASEVLERSVTSYWVEVTAADQQTGTPEWWRGEEAERAQLQTRVCDSVRGP